MEQLKSISSAIAKLKIAYPYYFKDLSVEEMAGMVSMYHDCLYMFDESIIDEAIKFIVRRSKFMPTLSEIVNECEKLIVTRKQNILLTMIDAGYFAEPSEIKKAEKFIQDDNIPSWFLEDMKKYGYLCANELTGGKEKNLLEDSYD